eukprot:TRINITY_DN5534_c0_g1_i1.p1 TRINITY_DN5534_c0_g1~~TRINITY_DN5534_c0_g1_i1.p1  ORF type:complete len:544 (+),score=140.85 TRINITY_DN5534_c0_g1_i1:31-1632(+)
MKKVITKMKFFENRYFSSTTKKFKLIETMEISEIKKELDDGRITSVELTKKCFDKIKENKNLNAFISIFENEALDKAHKSDIKRYKKQELGKLEGIPIALKDVFLTEKLKTTSGSKMLESFIPPYSSNVSDKLDKEGYVLLGKTNLDEFCMGSTNKHSSYGVSISPWSNFWAGAPKKITPGGSSGGSAVAVSSGMCFGAFGTDTGGSIRQPASYCGIVGLKPSYGRISRWGLISFASSLDTPSIMGKTVEDVSLILECTAGLDKRDATSFDYKVDDYYSKIKNIENAEGLTIGIPEEYNVSELSKEHRDLWRQSVEKMERAGAKIKQISLPHTKYALPTYYILSSAEASSNLSRYDGIRYGGVEIDDKSFENIQIDEFLKLNRDRGFGMEVKRRLLIGTFVLSRSSFDSFYLQALKVRRLIKNDYDYVFNKESGDAVDVIITPTAPSSSFPIDQKMDPIDEYLNDVMTIPSNLAGLPAISVPFDLDQHKLPFGIQIIGSYMGETKLLQSAKVLQMNSNFYQKRFLDKVISTKI